MAFLPNQSTRNSFQAFDQIGDGQLGADSSPAAECDHLSVELHQFGFNIRTDGGKSRMQLVKNLLCQDVTAVVCDEDQMHMDQKVAASPMT